MKKSFRGFSFMELMLALVIVAIVAGSAFETLQIAFRSKKGVDGAVDAAERSSVSMEFLRRDLESALPPTGMLANLFQGFQTQGDHGDNISDLIFFAASTENQNLPTDVRLIEYTIANDPQDNNRPALVRKVTSNLLSIADATTGAGYAEEYVCRNVQSFTVEFYDADNVVDAATPGTGYPTWDSTQAASDLGAQQSGALPQAVRVTLVLSPTTPDAKPQTITRMLALPCWAPATQPATTGTTGGTTGTTGGAP